MTIKELKDILEKMIKEGKGNYDVLLGDNCTITDTYVDNVLSRYFLDSEEFDY